MYGPVIEQTSGDHNVSKYTKNVRLNFGKMCIKLSTIHLYTTIMSLGLNIHKDKTKSSVHTGHIVWNEMILTTYLSVC